MTLFRKRTKPVLSHLPPDPKADNAAIQHLLHGLRVHPTRPLIEYVSPHVEDAVEQEFPQVIYYGPFQHPRD